MKRKVALAILGMTAMAATSAFGQGAVIFNNYATPYVPITLDGANIGAASGVTISLWAGLNGGALSEIGVANWSTFDGYTDAFQSFVIPGFVGGQTWDLQLRASGAGVDQVASVGPIITTSNIGDLGASPPETPTTVYTPGFVVVVPEPTTFALAGLGAAALLIFRRRD